MELHEGLFVAPEEIDLDAPDPHRGDVREFGATRHGDVYFILRCLGRVVPIAV